MSTPIFLVSPGRALGAVALLSLFACSDDEPRELADAGSHDSGSAPETRDAGEAPPTIDRVPDANEQQARGAGCDLSGRWIMTERRYISVLGSNQVAFSWFYVELSQRDDQVTMTTAMNCGGVTQGLPAIEVTIEDTPSWPAYMKQVRYDGRKGTSREDGEQCQIAFDKAVLVRGATVAAYRDLTRPMPELEQSATDTDPGWEDWDEDGKPGVTMRVSGTIWGSIYEASRTWSEYSGTSPRDAGSIRLGNRWGQERVTLGYDDSPLLVYEAIRDPDDAEQFVELTRLLPGQATGDDAARCQAIRELAPTLTPNANKTMLR
jgi:hypothetical protein